MESKYVELVKSNSSASFKEYDVSLLSNEELENAVYKKNGEIKHLMENFELQFGLIEKEYLRAARNRKRMFIAMVIASVIYIASLSYMFYLSY